jgi:hypothetical protein
MSDTTIIKSKDNGYTGYLARQEVVLVEAYGFYHVQERGSSRRKTFTYRTLKGAEKKFEQLASVMVTK